MQSPWSKSSFLELAKWESRDFAVIGSKNDTANLVPPSPVIDPIICDARQVLPDWDIWQLTPLFFPGESHGQRSLAGYSSWSCKSWTWLSHSTTTTIPTTKVEMTKASYDKYPWELAWPDKEHAACDCVSESKSVQLATRCTAVHVHFRWWRSERRSLVLKPSSEETEHKGKFSSSVLYRGPTANCLNRCRLMRTMNSPVCELAWTAGL